MTDGQGRPYVRSGQAEATPEPEEGQEATSTPEDHKVGAPSRVYFFVTLTFLLAITYLVGEAVCGVAYGDTLGAWWATEVYGSFVQEYGWWERWLFVHVASGLLFWLLCGLQLYYRPLRHWDGGRPHRWL